MNDIAGALKHFKKADPVLHRAAQKVKKHLARRPEIRKADKLFASLAESIVSQQLSVKASDTIWTRLVKVCGGAVTPESIASASLPKMRTAGLSGSKAKALKALAKEIRNGLHLPALRTYTPEEATEALTKVWGVGPWTAEMFLMFGLSHPDIFSARDLGLVRAMETLYGLQNPSIETLEAIALTWSPHRTVACRVLWKFRDTKPTIKKVRFLL